jgi:hypothetical protein
MAKEVPTQIHSYEKFTSRLICVGIGNWRTQVTVNHPVRDVAGSTPARRTSLCEIDYKKLAPASVTQRTSVADS